MRTIQAILVMLCAVLFTAGAASIGDAATPLRLSGGSKIARVIEVDFACKLTKHGLVCNNENNEGSGGSKHKCGPWNNWCNGMEQGSNQQCGPWNNWCNGMQQGSTHQCGPWNNWCGQAQGGGGGGGGQGKKKCGPWNNFCGGQGDMQQGGMQQQGGCLADDQKTEVPCDGGQQGGGGKKKNGGMQQGSQCGPGETPSSLGCLKDCPPGTTMDYGTCVPTKKQ